MIQSGMMTKKRKKFGKGTTRARTTEDDTEKRNWKPRIFALSSVNHVASRSSRDFYWSLLGFLLLEVFSDKRSLSGSSVDRVYCWHGGIRRAIRVYTRNFVDLGRHDGIDDFADGL